MSTSMVQHNFLGPLRVDALFCPLIMEAMLGGAWTRSLFPLQRRVPGQFPPVQPPTLLLLRPRTPGPNY